MSRTRGFLAVAMVVSAFVAPWWIGVSVALALSVRYRAWEVLLFGMLLDILWLPMSAAYGIPLGSLCATTLVWALEPLRKQFLFDYE